MAKAIEQQNKKVEEESEAMEKAIDNKASEKMAAVGDAAEKKLDQKGIKCRKV